LLALRLARAKAQAVTPAASAIVLAADTVVAVGRRILPKAQSEQQARECLALLSARSHRVYTGVAVRAPNGQTRDRLAETRVAFKRLSPAEIEWLLQVLNDVRVGGWLALGEPEELEPPEINETNAPYLLAMEAAGYFQAQLLAALAHHEPMQSDES
jgi:predicted house-cleaning NTP pyrophosphatase (Maf/HAM1 superfamily)